MKRNQNINFSLSPGTVRVNVLSPADLSVYPPPLRAIVALVYNVLKAFMEMNSTLFDELTATYKSDRQR